MADQFTVPEDYQESFRRLIPYVAAPLQSDEEVLQSLLIYLKLGGEKLARIAIDAFNVALRLYHAEMIKQLREEVLLGDDKDDSDDETGEDDKDESGDEDSDGSDDDSNDDSDDDSNDDSDDDSNDDSDDDSDDLD